MGNDKEGIYWICFSINFYFSSVSVNFIFSTEGEKAVRVIKCWDWTEEAAQAILACLGNCPFSL